MLSLSYVAYIHIRSECTVRFSEAVSSYIKLCEPYYCVTHATRLFLETSPQILACWRLTRAITISLNHANTAPLVWLPSDLCATNAGRWDI